MSKPRAFIWGASGHAKVLADAALCEGRLELVGFVDELHPERQGANILGLPVLGGVDVLSQLREQGVEQALLGIGDCATRRLVSQRAVAAGFQLGTVIHPASVLARGVDIGAGTVVFAGVVVNVGSHVGTAAVLNTACSVDHDCEVGDGVHLSPGVRLAGNVTIGELSWVGLGASIIQGVQIGARSVVGAGSVVLRDVPSDVVAYGVPASVRRTREA